MHLIFIAHAYPRHDGDVAGAFVERLAVALVDRGHGVTVVAPADEGAGGRDERRGVHVHRVRYAPAARETLAYRGTMADTARSRAGLVLAGALVWRQAMHVVRLARRGAPDLVHAHWWVPGGVSAWLARRLRGLRYVVTLHGTDVRVLESSRVTRAMGRRVLRGAVAVTAVSEYLAERAAAVAGLDAARMLIQPMPADLTRFTRTSQGGGGIVTVGRLVGQKRIDIVLEAVQRLQQRGRTVTLTIIGEGPLRGALEEHAQRLGIAERTRFVGEIPPERLAEVLGDADVFAFPAVGEGLGLAAAEALLMGIPVVATREGGGVVDIVPDRGPGRLVPQGEPTAMAAAIEELLDQPGVRQRAVEEGERLRDLLAPDRVAERFEHLYERVAGPETRRHA
ncbi:MAG: glycosyltransferase [Gemmatimonadales bacterium]